MIQSGIIAWRSPSNIAVVKYWGKKGFQLPGNSSVSMSLTNCFTETKIEYSQKTVPDTPSFSFLFQGERSVDFETRTGRFLEIAMRELPALKNLHLQIESSNSFPHSAGIASSASAISSMALCLCSINQQVSNTTETQEHFLCRASQLARLGSGSACRSIYGGWVLWGETMGFMSSSDDFAVPVPDLSNNIFSTYYDAILIVNSGIKKVKSSEGHKLMEANPYREIKFRTGNQNAVKLLGALSSGNSQLFRNIAEYEAMSLHAMFLTSDPSFLLIKSETLHIINSLNRFRSDTGLEFSFTLDAGPNIHLLYPESARARLVSLIETDLVAYCENGMWIDDRIGRGPELIQN